MIQVTPRTPATVAISRYGRQAGLHEIFPEPKPESDNEDYLEMKEFLESGMNPEDVPSKIKVLQNFFPLHQNYRLISIFLQVNISGEVYKNAGAFGGTYELSESKLVNGKNHWIQSNLEL